MLSLMQAFPTNAQESRISINDGYTNNGIYYSVYEIETSTASLFSVGDTITITREFQFDGIIKPSSTMSYSETINNVTYKGTLQLVSFSFEGDHTIALYKGTLTAIN